MQILQQETLQRVQIQMVLYELPRTLVHVLKDQLNLMEGEYNCKKSSRCYRLCQYILEDTRAWQDRSQGRHSGTGGTRRPQLPRCIHRDRWGWDKRLARRCIHTRGIHYHPRLSDSLRGRERGRGTPRVQEEDNHSHHSHQVLDSQCSLVRIPLWRWRHSQAVPPCHTHTLGMIRLRVIPTRTCPGTPDILQSFELRLCSAATPAPPLPPLPSS